MKSGVRDKKCVAIVLAAGKGSRMGTTVQKQFLEINEKPVLYYSLAIFEKSLYIDEVVLVVGKEQMDFCQREIVEKFQFHKVTKMVEGGRERFESVYFGLRALEQINPDYVFIHDGARPFVEEDIIARTYDGVCRYKACVAGMPSKDTIKMVDELGIVIGTPDRRSLWQIQTPQVFEYELIHEAYCKLMENLVASVTDDAMVLETVSGFRAKLVEGSYENIKITTPEDLYVAEAFLKKRLTRH